MEIVVIFIIDYSISSIKCQKIVKIALHSFPQLKSSNAFFCQTNSPKPKSLSSQRLQWSSHLRGKYFSLVVKKITKMIFLWTASSINRLLIAALDVEKVSKRTLNC